MSFVLMLVGLLATALGAILIGFGIPINEFSLGNTLILAGTVTAVGGLIIFALSRAVSQLARIADAMGSRPLASAMPAAPGPYDPSQPDLGRAAPRPPAAPRAPAPALSPAPRAPEPRLSGDEFDPPVEVEPVRPAPAPRSPAAELPEEPSLAPRAGRTPAAPEAPGTGWRPPRPAADARPRKPAVPDPRRPAAPQPASDNPFEAAWPDERKPGAPAPAAPPRREPVLDIGPDAGAGTAAKQEPVTVLKSGIVDGMAYTLYTDGSIEAELAQGVVRFGSIEELRNHLEKSA